MTRQFAILAFSLVAGCASAPSSNLEFRRSGQPPAIAPITEAHEASPATPARELTLEPPRSLAVQPDAQPFPFAEELSLTAFSHTTAAPQADESLRNSRFTIKAGPYSLDESEFDDGYIVNLSWMQFFTSIFALEFELGYYYADTIFDGVESWGIPLMVNARLNLPVWVLDIYGGLGAGTIYYDIDVTDGWVLAGNAFIGASVNLADSIALGLEAKYYLTENVSEIGDGLDATAIMLTIGFSR